MEPMITWVIVVINEKGGCGKTTTSVQIAYNLAKIGNVLLIDLDQSAYATMHLTGKTDHPKGIFDVLSTEGKIPLNEAAVKLPPNWGNLLLIPADRRLKDLSLYMNNMLNRDWVLKRSLDATNSFFKYIVIDTPPNLGVETTNALLSATHYLIVTDASQYSQKAISVVRFYAQRVKEQVNPELKELGLLLTCFQKNTSNDVKETLTFLKNDELFLKDHIIPHSVKVGESQKLNKALGDAFPSTLIAKKYKKLSHHLMETIA